MPIRRLYLGKQELLVEGAWTVWSSGVMHNQIELPKGSKIGIILMEEILM